LRQKAFPTNFVDHGQRFHSNKSNSTASSSHLSTSASAPVAQQMSTTLTNLLHRNTEVGPLPLSATFLPRPLPSTCHNAPGKYKLQYFNSTSTDKTVQQVAVPLSITTLHLQSNSNAHTHA